MEEDSLRGVKKNMCEVKNSLKGTWEMREIFYSLHFELFRDENEWRHL